MPVMELEKASRDRNRAYDSDFSDKAAFGTSTSTSESDYSSTKGKLNGLSELRPTTNPRTTMSEGKRSSVERAFTSFTESLSLSSGEFQDNLQRTFSSIASTFSKDTGSTSTSESGYDQLGSSSSSSGGLSLKNRKWSELPVVFTDTLRSRVSSSISSGSRSTSYNSSSTNNSTLSSHSNSTRMNSDAFAITVDSSGLVLRESTYEDSGSSASSSVASWQETASRDRSLLDVIGEREEDDDSSSSGSGSASDGEGRDDKQNRDVGDDGTPYEYDDDHTEFDSDVGIDDLGAVMLQLGSCQFEPDSASLSCDEEDYSYSSEMFPPVVSNYLGQTSVNRGVGDNEKTGLSSDATRNALFKKQLRHRNSAQRPVTMDEDGITSFFTKAFSCGVRPA